MKENLIKRSIREGESVSERKVLNYNIKYHALSVPAHSHSAPPCLVFPVCSVFLYVPSTLICPATVLCTPSEPNDSALSIIPLAIFPAVPTSTRGFPGVRKLKGTFFRNKLRCSVLSCACSEWVLAIHVCVSNYFAFAAL